MQLLNTLYVTTSDTYLNLDNDTLRVEVEKETQCPRGLKPSQKNKPVVSGAASR